mmetsp:Transcript_1262/g.2650  ORF Transcript_1262/g.2650 Transcript_1262/m.2650 type:complete len:117 (-) Transcript_1262:22-372(-)
MRGESRVQLLEELVRLSSEYGDYWVRLGGRQEGSHRNEERTSRGFRGLSQRLSDAGPLDLARTCVQTDADRLASVQKQGAEPASDASAVGLGSWLEGPAVMKSAPGEASRVKASAF